MSHDRSVEASRFFVEIFGLKGIGCNVRFSRDRFDLVGTGKLLGVS